MPVLEMITEKFARMFGTTLSSLLKRIVNVNVMSVDMLKYVEFMKGIPLPASLHVFKMDPLRGSSVFIVESQVMFALVDIMFGGSGRETFKIEGRDFTTIENNLIKRVILSALSDLEKVLILVNLYHPAFQVSLPLKFSQTRQYPSPLSALT